jgi:hypothetical protein
MTMAAVSTFAKGDTTMKPYGNTDPPTPLKQPTFDELSDLTPTDVSQPPVADVQVVLDSWRRDAATIAIQRLDAEIARVTALRNAANPCTVTRDSATHYLRILKKRRARVLGR